MKVNEILNETTTSGGIATVAGGQAPAFTRGASIYGQERKKKTNEDEGTDYDVEVYPPYDVALTFNDRVVAKIDIDEWKILNRKVNKALRNNKG